MAPPAFPTVVRAFPLAFLLHDLEEVATVERWGRQHARRAPRPLARVLRHTTAQFAVAVAWLFAAVWLVTVRAARPERRRADVRLYAAGVVALGLNGVSHLGQALLLRRYVPGVVTAALVAVPYAVYALRRTAREGLLTGRDWRTAGLLAGPLAGLLAGSGLALGALLTRRRFGR